MAAFAAWLRRLVSGIPVFAFEFPCCLLLVPVASRMVVCYRAGVDEARLLEKLRLIEALFAGATTDGERIAAGEARSRIQARLGASEAAEPPMEYQFSLNDVWSRKVFLALCRRYGIEPYRRRGQRRTTVMARVSKRFVDETLWPEFEQISTELRKHLTEVTDRIISSAIHEDASEASELEPVAQLGPAR